MEIKKDDLEQALSSEAVKTPQISKDLEIGHHQGALSTLVNERNELVKMVGNVEAVMQAHMKRLEELGIKIQQQE